MRDFVGISAIVLIVITVVVAVGVTIGYKLKWIKGESN